MTRETEIRERLGKITPGPWAYEGMDKGQGWVLGYKDPTDEDILEYVCESDLMNYGDAIFIANAPTDIVALLQANKDLTGENEALREQIGQLQGSANFLVCPRCSNVFHDEDMETRPKDYWTCPLCYTIQHIACRGPLSNDHELQDIEHLRQVVAAARAVIKGDWPAKGSLIPLIDALANLPKGGEHE